MSMPAKLAGEGKESVKAGLPLDLDAIRVDGGTQPRAAISDDVIADYAAAMGDGASLPPVTVFYDGSDYWLADGFHRYRAARQLGLVEIEADIRQGTRRDAVLFSVGANAAHGLPRTREDKRRAVMVLLGDAEWSKWSDREIARQCAVSHPTVATMRAEYTGKSFQYAERTFTHPKTGAPAQMRTAGINGNRSAVPPPERPAPSPIRSTVGEAMRAAPAGPTPLEQRHINMTLDGLDRLLAGAEFWPDPQDAMTALAPYPVAGRKVPIVLEWLARLQTAMQQPGHNEARESCSSLH